MESESGLGTRMIKDDMEPKKTHALRKELGLDTTVHLSSKQVKEAYERIIPGLLVFTGAEGLDLMILQV